jgi:hypothetical protein
MIKVQYNSNTGITEFFEIQEKRRDKYPTRYFFWLKPSTKKIKVEKVLYRKIIGSFFENYFRDFYSHRTVQYFPLSGKLYKVKSNKFYSKGQLKNITEAIDWIWFLRPAMNYASNIKIIKSKGSNSLVGKLENEFRDLFDVQSLRRIKPLTIQIINNDKLYKEC